MKREELGTGSQIKMVAAGVVVSTIVALLVVLGIARSGRLRRGEHAVSGDGAMPGGTARAVTSAPAETVQPAVDTEMPAVVPSHFTEDLILPDITETGQDVERDDDTVGRSPEGV